MLTRRLGRVGLTVTEMGLGGSPLGNRATPMTESQAEAVIDAAWSAGIRYFDTAPLYGHGLAEARLGHALRWKPRDEFVISSKVGRILRSAPRSSVDYGPWASGLPFACHYDFSYDGTMRAFQDSLQRMGLERIEVVFIHDVDVFTFGSEQPEIFRQAMDGAYKALLSLREQRVIKAIGVGVNEWEPCYEALKLGDFDCFLLAGRYTLLEQDSLDPFLSLCMKREVAVVLGGGLNSGILATGGVQGARHNYAPASTEVLERVRKIEAVCARYRVPLAAAALQFLVGHPAVASHIPGARTVAQIEQNVGWMNHPIPPQLWSDLKDEGIVRADAPVPGGR